MVRRCMPAGDRRPDRGKRWVWWAAAVVSSVVFTGLPAVSASAMSLYDWSAIGHRGFPTVRHTEDTIASFDAARRAGASAVELDLRLTSDLQPLVMHDGSLDRTTTCSGKVAELTMRAIQDCRGKVSGEPLPSAGRVLSWASRRDINVILEIKKDHWDRWTVQQFAALDALITRNDMARRVVLMSFECGLLQRAEEANPSLETDWIIEGWPGLGVVKSHSDVVNVRTSELSVARVRALHRAGLRVFGRKTNSVRNWARLARVGADGLLTDRTADYVRWRDRHSHRRHQR
jgi:glycerophosphoryl diester phosphodiesterase